MEESSRLSRAYASRTRTDSFVDLDSAHVRESFLRGTRGLRRYLEFPAKFLAALPGKIRISIDSVLSLERMASNGEKTTRTLEVG